MAVTEECEIMSLRKTRRQDIEEIKNEKYIIILINLFIKPNSLNKINNPNIISENMI